VNSTNPNRGHYSPPPTVTYGTKDTKTADRGASDGKTGSARKNGGTR
jgi:hypothetical protein